MPKDNQKTKNVPLDNNMPNSNQSPIQSLYVSEYMKAMETIEKSRREKEQRFTKYIESLENQSLKSTHLRTLLKFQRLNAPNKTMRDCNTIPIACIRKDQSPEQNPITLKVNEYGFGLSGLNRCKNPFCVLCSKSRAGERAHRIKKGIEGAFDSGLGVYFVTFTIPRQENIKTARTEINNRWKHMTKLFARWKRKYNIQTYYARALDVTFKRYIKKQRYHLHIHTVIVLDDVELLGILNENLKPKHHKTMESLLIEQWIDLNRKGMVCKAVSQDVQKVVNTDNDTGRVSRYCGKMAGLALEISNGTQKKSKGNSSLMDLMLSNTEQTKFIYREYLTGMKKARTLQFSRFWDDLIELSDDEPLESFDFNIPLDKWRIIEPVWVELAEKIQFELFTQSVNSQGEPDVYRQYQIIKDVNWWIKQAKDTEFLKLYLYQSL